MAKKAVVSWILMLLVTNILPLMVTPHFARSTNLSQYPMNASFYQAGTQALGNFTIVALPDTQVYSASHPDIFDNQTQWIVDNADGRNTVFVTHEGDIVNDYGSVSQWNNANNSLSKLDAGNVSYSVLPGNHDGSPGNLNNYNVYFNYSRFMGKGWYGGAYQNDNSNSFELFHGGQDDYLIFHFQYQPSDQVLEWANDTLQNYPERRVIVTTHSYLNIDGTRTDIGNTIWQNFVLPHADQIFLVLCGHNHAEARRADITNGHTVYQIMADYQDRTNGGDGWLRTLEFHPVEGKIYVRTYSPYINDYETDADSQFTLDYHMTSAQEPTLWLTPTSVTCRKYGENFTIKMNAFDAFDVSGTKFEITYNTTLLDYVGIAWNAWGTGTVTVDEAAGNITGSTSGAPLTDDQSLITMDFKAAYYRIWRDLPGCINNQNGTIFIRWSSLSYPSGPDLPYERGDGGLKQINVGPDVVCTFAPVQGDLNNDGRVDMFDLSTLAVFYETANPEYDLASDEIIDVYDLVVVGSNYGFEYVSTPRTLAMVDSSLTSPSGTYRWMDVANQAYSNSYRNNYNYSQASVTVTYDEVGKTLAGMLIARNLKPNFAYQLKLVGTPGTIDNERIGLAGRWWQETWSGSAWIAGTNLNDKGNGSSPNPNDATYYARRFVTDPSSPTGYHYRYTGYLVFDYFITDSNGDVSIEFKTGSCCHVLWKTSQRSRTVDDGPLKTVTFDPNPCQMAYDQDYPPSTVSMFGEWERLPMGGVNLMPGRYDCQILLTEESFHGTGPLEGNWAAAMTGEIIFTII